MTSRNISVLSLYFVCVHKPTLYSGIDQFILELYIDVFELPPALRANSNTTYGQNNLMQTRAIRSAMTQRLTVVQGPPGSPMRFRNLLVAKALLPQQLWKHICIVFLWIAGTGKTFTGVNIAYLYYQLNQTREDGIEGKIMYCGPSNSSVDVALSMQPFCLKAQQHFT